MSAKIQDILKLYGQIGVQRLKNIFAPYSATGKTVKSIRDEVTEGRLRFFARAGLKAMEDGRGPRKSSTYEGFDKNLDEWIRARGFPSKTSKNGVVYYRIGNQWYSAKSLAWKINKSGDKLYRSGGGREVYSEELEKLVEELTRVIKKANHDEVMAKVRDSIRGMEKAA